MSDWGDDEYDGIEAEPIDVDDAPPAAAAGRAFGVDIGGLAGELVDVAVKNAVRKQVAEMADAAVSEALTEELIEALRARAQAAAEAAVREQVEANEAEPADDASPAGDVDEPELYFGSVDEFVREYLCKVYRRRVDGSGRQRVWAAEWWRYPEAVIRLEALWRSWEKLRQDASMGMSVWWRDHADHHMAVLLDPSGPFGKATEQQNSNAADAPLPYAAPPEGMFSDERQPASAG